MLIHSSYFHSGPYITWCAKCSGGHLCSLCCGNVLFQGATCGGRYTVASAQCTSSIINLNFSKRKLIISQLMDGV
jgi:hypothetical protein